MRLKPGAGKHAVPSAKKRRVQSLGFFLIGWKAQAFFDWLDNVAHVFKPVVQFNAKLKQKEMTFLNTVFLLLSRFTNHRRER